MLRKPYPTVPIQMKYNNTWTSSHQALSNFFSDLLNGKTITNTNWSNNINIDNTIQNFINSTLKNDETLEIPTYNEIKDIIKRFKPHKSPGLDSITSALLKTNPTLMVKLLHPLISYIWEHNNIPDTLQTGILIPIPKTSIPSTDPSTYRPITLLSLIFKILEALIQSKL